MFVLRSGRLQSVLRSLRSVFCVFWECLAIFQIVGRKGVGHAGRKGVGHAGPQCLRGVRIAACGQLQSKFKGSALITKYDLAIKVPILLLSFFNKPEETASWPRPDGAGIFCCVLMIL